MIKSSKPSKQRVFKKTAPIHERRKMMSSTLSKELRNKYKKRNLPVRKGDEVTIMRGAYKGLKGKVERVMRSNYKVFVEGIVYEKKNGSKVKVGLDSSKLMIINLNNNDTKRLSGGKDE